MVIIKDLRERRERKGKTQLECSRETDIPLRTIQRYESGDSIGDSEYLIRLLNYYEIDIQEITKQIQLDD